MPLPNCGPENTATVTTLRPDETRRISTMRLDRLVTPDYLSQLCRLKANSAGCIMMEVEIWSDIMCPFCYLGKQNFAKALAGFPDKDKVNITWRSFQLMPGMKTQPGTSINEFLALSKGISEEHAAKMHAQMTERGREAGLDYRFDKVVVANTLMAHIFLHYAKRYGKQDEAQGKLFRAYFTDGKNVDDPGVLEALAGELDIDPAEWNRAKNDPAFREEVRNDIREAAELGIQGVPFFLFNRKYAVSGAREPGVFLGALHQVFREEENKSHS